jgi:Holliday junction resolvase
MTVSSRRKGVRGEREVTRLLEAAGFTVRNLEGTGDQLVIARDGVLLHVESKRHERVRLPEWLQQAAREAPAGAVPVVAFRQSRKTWYVALPLADFIGLAGD